MANDKILLLHGNYRVLEKLPRVTPQSAEVGRVLSRRPHKTVLTYSALFSAKDIVRQTQRSLSSLAHRVCFLLCPPKVSWALASVSFFPPLLSIALHSWLPLHLFTPPHSFYAGISHGFLQASLSSLSTQIDRNPCLPED